MLERHLLRHDHDPDAVVLLDDAGRAVGQRDRFAVHTENTPLHLAFSSYLFDDAGRVLLTRRALNKLTWPGVWTNSCCGHPRPGEAIPDAVARRVREEVGLTVRDLRCVLPDFRYRAVDTSGIVENEICPVFVGRVDPSQLILDPDEVLDHTWVPWADLTRAVASADRVFSPWAALQVPLLDAVLAPETPHTAELPGVDSTLELVQAELTQQSERLARQWSRFIPAGSPGILGDDLPAWLDRLASVGGKRLRANLCHWGFVAVGGDVDSAGHQHLITAAAALELLHFFALVHDDVMDDSDTRRGMPSAHVQAARWHRQTHGQGDADAFGRNLAVLLGDLAHAEADRLAAELPGPLREYWYDLNIELIAGQRADLTGAAEGRRDLGQAERVAQLKSGSYSVERPLQLGALAAGASASSREALAVYGRHVGRAFALRDDELGIWGDPVVTGKPAGDDLRSGKATVILALAQATLRGAPAAALTRIGTPATTEEDVALLQEALITSGVKGRVEAMIAEEVDLARAALRRSPFTPAGVAGLREMADRIAWRNA